MTCFQGKKNVEVRPAHTNKGEIVQRLLYQYADTEFCMCAGDDKTDEDMFHSMARIFSTATPGLSGGCPGTRPTIAPPESLKLFPSLSNGAGLPDGDHAEPVESQLDPSAMYMIAIEAREVSPRSRALAGLFLRMTERLLTHCDLAQSQGARMTMANAVLESPEQMVGVLEQLAAVSRQDDVKPE